MATIRAICRERNIPVGHPHVSAANVAQAVEEGYRFLMAGPTRSYAALERAAELTGRK